MRRKVVVIGDRDVVADGGQHAKVVTWPSPDAVGADVVVIADASHLAEVAELVARRSPAAVVIATDPAWCAEVLERTYFPRGRVFAADDVAAAVDAVLGDSGAELGITLCDEGPALARVGAGGVFAI